MAVVIVGAGRSGTSMLARMLNLCGLYIGETEDFDAADNYNVKGYWEHRYLAGLNHRLLSHFGGSFDVPPYLPPGWEDDPKLEPFYDEARDLHATTFGDRLDWVWKYPSAGLTLPFWRKILPDFQVILCVRNPADYASSAENKFGWSRQYSHNMWLYYNVMVLAQTRPQERFITFYEDYFPDYRKGLMPVMQFAGLPGVDQSSSIADEIAAFHDQRMNHHNSTFEDLLVDQDATYYARELYMELLSGGSEGSGVSVPKLADAFMPQLGRRIRNEAQAVAQYHELQAQYGRAQNQMQELHGEMQQLKDELRETKQLLNTRSHRAASQLQALVTRYLSRPEPERSNFTSAPKATDAAGSH